MNKLQLAATVVVSLAVTPPAFAQFGVPSLPSASGSGGATAADIDRFMDSVASADKLTIASSTHLLEAVGTKEQIDKYKAETKAANAVADPKEKEASVQQAEKNKNADLAKTDFIKIKEEMAKRSDAKQKQAVRDSLWNLALAGLKDADLVMTGKKMVSGTPDPAIASRIVGVKDALPKLVSQGESLTKIVGSAKTLMTVAGLEALPAKASDAPKATNSL